MRANKGQCTGRPTQRSCGRVNKTDEGCPQNGHGDECQKAFVFALLFSTSMGLQ